MTWRDSVRSIEALFNEMIDPVTLRHVPVCCSQASGGFLYHPSVWWEYNALYPGHKPGWTAHAHPVINVSFCPFCGTRLPPYPPNIENGGTWTTRDLKSQKRVLNRLHSLAKVWREKNLLEDSETLIAATILLSRLRSVHPRDQSE